MLEQISRKNYIQQLKRVLGGVALCSSILCVSFDAKASEQGDLDGDGSHDRTVFRSSEGHWYVNFTTSPSVALSYNWGLPGDFPVSGRYSSTTGGDLVVWRPSDGVWYIRKYNSALTYPSASAFQWGISGDKPSPCDFTGDGRNELTVWRSSDGTWYRRISTSSDSTTYLTAAAQQWGLAGDTPIPADYDGDGKCDHAVFRSGAWYIILSSTSTPTGATIAWGISSDVPVPGQYTSDTDLDFAVYRAVSGGESLWVIRNSNNAGLTAITYGWGLQSDQPVPADYDGDNKTDLAVWRPANGVWYVRTSSSSYNTAQAFQFGLNGDIAMGDRRGADPASSATAPTPAKKPKKKSKK